MRPEEGEGVQTNKQSGENTRALHLRKDGTTPYPLVRLDAGGTPNQKMEAATVALRFHIMNGVAAGIEAATERCLELLAQQEKNGHCAIGKADEAVGDSHAPIWYRAMASLRLTTAEHWGMSDDLAKLRDATKRWWEAEFSICNALLVPSGPKAGSVVGPGARPKLGWSPIRDFVYQVARGMRTTAKVGKASMAGAAQDTFACYLAPQIAALSDGFGARFDAAPCRLHDTMIVHRFAGGHVANFPNGMEWQKTFCRQAWVVYETGEIGLDKAGPYFDSIKGEPEVITFEGAHA